MNTIPVVTDKLGRMRDIGSALLEQNIVLLSGEIDTRQAELVTSALLYLDAQPGARPVCVYINSPGGSVVDGFAIHDVLRQCAHPVHTYCMGQASSMAALLLAAGDRRFALPNSRIMIHQPSGGAAGQCDDIQIAAASIAAARARINGLLAAYTGQTPARIQEDTARDRFMAPGEAKEYGLIDEVLAEPARGAQRKEH